MLTHYYIIPAALFLCGCQSSSKQLTTSDPRQQQFKAEAGELNIQPQVNVTCEAVKSAPGCPEKSKHLNLCLDVYDATLEKAEHKDLATCAQIFQEKCVDCKELKRRVFPSGLCGSCLPDYIEVEGICRLLNETELVPVASIKCPYSQIYNKTMHSCVCPAEKPVFSRLGECVAQCNNEEHIVDNNCTCKPGYILNDSKECIKVRFNEIYASQLITCPVSQIAVSNHTRCSCPFGKPFISRQGLCVSHCEANEQSIDSKCVCKPGHLLDPSFGCKAMGHDHIYGSSVIKCTKGRVANADHTMCVCPNDQPLISRTGHCTAKCADGEDASDSQCVCKANHYVDASRGCVPLQDNQIFGDVVRNCTHGLVPSNDRSLCICPKGQLILPDSTCGSCVGMGELQSQDKCICQSDFVFLDGKCRRCSDLHRKTEGGTCGACLDGFGLINDKCVDSKAQSECPACNCVEENSVQGFFKPLFIDATKLGFGNSLDGCSGKECEYTDKVPAKTQNECAALCCRTPGCNGWMFGTEDGTTKCWFSQWDEARVTGRAVCSNQPLKWVEKA